MLNEIRQSLNEISSRLDAIEASLPSLDHFGVQSSKPGVIMAERLNDPARYSALSAGTLSGRVVYDAVAGGTRWQVLQGEFSIPNGDQFRISFSRPVGAGESLWVQWEAMFDPRWQQGSKTFQVADDMRARNGGSIQLEVNSFACHRETNGSPVVGNYQITPAIRFYRPPLQPVSVMNGRLRNVQTAIMGLMGSQLENANPPQRHVGEGGTQYFVRPDQWTRYTLNYDMASWRLRLWIADENTDPTLVIDSPVQMADVSRRFISWWVEINSSEGRGGAQSDCYMWVRNALASTGEIELGGRPLRGSA